MRLPGVLSLRFAAAASVAAAAASGLGGHVGAIPPYGGTVPPSDFYSNPLILPDLPDPDVIQDASTGEWYAFGTTDYWSAYSSSLHILPIMESSDLIHWRFVRDTFSPPGVPPTPGSPTEPAWAGSVFLWAPEVHHIEGRYVMYYAASSSAAGGSAIGVATASSPAGPWHDLGRPLIGPRPNPAGGFFDTIDPDEIRAEDGQRYLYYGSFSGGIWVVPLAPDGLSLKPKAKPIQVTASGRYEGTSVVYHQGYYYLFASSGNCCAGPNTGYEEVVGRSRSPVGPFRDELGIGLLQGGGTVVLADNGNQYVGPGGGTVFQAAPGHYWLIFHVIPERSPYLTSGANARPAALEPIEWGPGGWPAVNHGLGMTTGAQLGPLYDSHLPPQPLGRDPLLSVPVPGALLPQYSDDFAGGRIGPQWHWVNEVRSGWSLSVDPGTLTIYTAPGDIYETADDAENLLLERAPLGNFIVETKLSLHPSEDYQQAGLLIWQSHNALFRLSAGYNSGSDVTEWAKQTSVTSLYAGFSCTNYPPDTCPVYGSGFLEVPGFSPAAKAAGGSGVWTWLRILKLGNEVTAYTSINGRAWSPGATYNTDGFSPKAPLYLGLIAVAAGAPSAVPAHFAYVRVFRLSGASQPAAGASG